MAGLFTPLTDAPSRFAKKVADRIDQPRMPSRTFDEGSFLGNYEDFANKLTSQIRGGLAGSVQGLGNLASDMTSPMSIASSLAGAPWLRNVIQGGKAASRAIGPTIDIIDSPAVRQMAPSADDVTALIGDMQRNLARLPSRTPVAPQGSISPLSPSFTRPDMVPVGGEAFANISRAKRMSDYASSVDDIAEAGSRASGKVRMPTGNVNVAEMMQSLARARGR